MKTLSRVAALLLAAVLALSCVSALAEGYSIPKNVLYRSGLSHAKIYAQVINPFSLKQSINGFDLDTGRT